MTNKGHLAERIAAEYLSKHGYDVLELNWKTRFCEVDIVARKSKIVYFVEVKYRQSSRWGSGFDYITTKKQQQMAFAAQIWVHNNYYQGDYALAAIELSGETPELKNFITEI